MLARLEEATCAGKVEIATEGLQCADCKSGREADLLNTVGLLPVVDESHYDPDPVLAHLVQDVIDRLPNLLVVLACTRQATHPPDQPSLTIHHLQHSCLLQVVYADVQFHMQRSTWHVFSAVKT